MDNVKMTVGELKFVNGEFLIAFPDCTGELLTGPEVEALVSALPSRVRSRLAMLAGTHAKDVNHLEQDARAAYERAAERLRDAIALRRVFDGAADGSGTEA